ncbi:hypothetical protein BHM03_00000443 [Ensete ventricosum]|uniref:Uncharacterized protein n=1 Tax=Ensete ventricosum TaxID=4639 RepID=A0A445M8J0_ENSVE|nr:hypothetical protein BHM03_00000443 [Ensete ventricosum]
MAPHSTDTLLGLVVRDAGGLDGTKEEACGALAAPVVDMTPAMELTTEGSAGQNVGVPFVEVDVSSRLGLSCVHRNIYTALLDEFGQSVDSRGSLSGLRSVDSLIPQFDSHVLHQGLSRGDGGALTWPLRCLSQ